METSISGPAWFVQVLLIHFFRRPVHPWAQVQGSERKTRKMGDTEWKDLGICMLRVFHVRANKSNSSNSSMICIYSHNIHSLHLFKSDFCQAHLYSFILQRYFRLQHCRLSLARLSDDSIADLLEKAGRWMSLKSGILRRPWWPLVPGPQCFVYWGHYRHYGHAADLGKARAFSGAGHGFPMIFHVFWDPRCFDTSWIGHAGFPKLLKLLSNICIRKAAACPKENSVCHGHW